MRETGRRESCVLQPYHECPLLDLQQDDVSALRHPGQQHSSGADGQPAHVQPTRRRVQLVDLGTARPERHQPAARTHWAYRRTQRLVELSKHQLINTPKDGARHYYHHQREVRTRQVV